MGLKSKPDFKVQTPSLTRRAELLLMWTQEPVTLDDDEEIEILHDSPAAAEDSAPQIPPDTISDAPAYNSALAKQVEATPLMSTAYVLKGHLAAIFHAV